MRPSVRVLSDELVGRIVDEALALLREPGVRVHNEEALGLLAEAGAEVDRSNLVVRIPERIVRAALASPPRAFDL